MLNFSVGNSFKSVPLQSMATINPQVLWNLPSFRARMGFHYMGDFASPYGLIPISGIGVSAYFYPFGLSTAYEIDADSTLYQKSKPGPYAFILITPTNFNLNIDRSRSASIGGSGAATAFSAFMIEACLGVGYDYPLGTNSVIALDAQLRSASASEEKTNQSISYSGIGVMVVFSTSYH